MSNINTEKALTSMRKASDGIWEETLKKHPGDVDEMMKALTSMYSWSKVLEGKSEASILVKEALLDLFASVNSVMSGYYRQGMISLRSCLEMILDFIYYVDHPIEYKRWRQASGTNVESKIGKWLEEGMLSADYNKFFVPESNVQGDLGAKAKSMYGKLSKFTHAQREEVMQIDKESMQMSFDIGKFGKCKSNFLDVVSLCNVALCIRFWTDFQASGDLKNDTLYLISLHADVVTP